MKPTQQTGKSAAAHDAEQAATDARNANTLKALCSYMTLNRIDRSTGAISALARSMNTSHTYLYRYLENKFKASDSAMAALESKIENFMTSALKAGEKPVNNSQVIASDFVVDGVARFLRHVRAHEFIGIGYGEAGAGKTKAAEIYAAQNSSTTLYIHLSVWRGGRHALVKQIAAAMRIYRKPKGEVLDDVLVDKLRGSGQLLTIDNAHRLTEASRKWLADFWEETKLPIALIGNPEIEDQWERNDQHGSRVGILRDVTLDLAKNRKNTVKHLLKLHLPAALGMETIEDEAGEALSHFGRCRAVEKRATLAAAILNSKDNEVSSPTEAWAMAKTQLVKAKKKLAAA